MSKIKHYLNWACLLLSPLLMIFLAEFLSRHHPLAALTWMLSYPAEVLLAYLLLIWVILFFALLFNNLGIANFLTLTIVNLLSIINYFKVPFRGEPFYPQDFLMWLETLAVMQLARFAIPALIIISVLVSLLWVALSFHFSPQLSKTWLRWSLWGFITLSGLAAFLFSTASWWQRTFHFEYDFQHNRQLIAYHRHGFIVSFMIRTFDSQITTPPDYNQTTINAITSQYRSLATPPPEFCESLPRRPLIVMVMMESFIDPDDLAKVSFTKDITPNYHRLRSRSQSGQLFVKSMGGGTS
ncbi:hypothetical protein FWH30_02900, partial [Microgenomates group bacterium]|nr:hypothetical protein [Microgenomates group bacterium]